MTTTAQVEAAWSTHIWAHSSIAVLTNKIFNREISDLSEDDVRDVSFQQQINFIEWLVKKSIEYPQISRGLGQDETFLVEIRYTREKDPHADKAGANYNAVRDALETIVGLVKSELGVSWDGTIDYYETQTEAVVINERDIAGSEVWSGVYRFQGFVRTLS